MDEEEFEVDFTPLIDVTFLLLIFFMVTATLNQPTKVKLPKAKSGNAEMVEGKIIVHIREGDDKEEMARVGDETDAAKIKLSGFKAKLANYSSLDVAMIRADSEVDFAFVDRVASTLRGLGVQKVILGVKDRPETGGGSE